MSVVYRYQEPGQPSLEDPQSHKKFLLLLGLAGLVIVLMVTVLIWGTSKNVKQQPQKQAADTVAEAFLAAVNDEDLKKLKQLYADGNRASDETIRSNIIDTIKSGVVSETCKPFGVSSENEEYRQSLFRCSLSDSQRSLEISANPNFTSTDGTLVVTSKRNSVVLYQIATGQQIYYNISEVAAIISGDKPAVSKEKTQ